MIASYDLLFIMSMMADFFLVVSFVLLILVNSDLSITSADAVEEDLLSFFTMILD